LQLEFFPGKPLDGNCKRKFFAENIPGKLQEIIFYWQTSKKTASKNFLRENRKENCRQKNLTGKTNDKLRKKINWKN